MTSNPLLKWLLIPMALLLVFVGVKLFSGGDATPGAPDTAGHLTPEEMKALGIAGDTPRDTVATLVAQVRQLRTELQTALGDNRQHRAENERLRAREGRSTSASRTPSTTNVAGWSRSAAGPPATGSRRRD